MLNSVQYVRSVCREKNIPIAKLEKECGFANGYLNPKKIAKIPYDRAQLISKYLAIPVEAILEGGENKKTPSATGEQRTGYGGLLKVNQKKAPSLSKDELGLIEKFRCLDERGKSAVMTVLNYEYDILSEPTASASEDAG